MEVDVRYDCAAVDWKTVADILKCVGMAYHEPNVHRRAFEASHVTVFVYRGDRLIGFGRAISDGVYQAALYDCAVLPDFQGRGLGTTIVESIMARVPTCNVILYATPGEQSFYQKHGFRKMATGMARFQNGAAMKEAGFTE